MKRISYKILLAVLAAGFLSAPQTHDCTGIAIKAQDGTRLLARTIEWKGGNLNSKLIIMPQGMKNIALTPTGENIPDMPSATQWTAVSDVTHPAFYYRTMYNSAIRKVDLTKINFAKVPYTVTDMDQTPRETFYERTF